MNGLLIIDKPPGITSHDVVAEVRRILRVRRVGHTGTLDPFATGVLVILVGVATRLAQFLSGVDKQYDAIFRLGAATDTGDVTGRITEQVPLRPDQWSTEAIESALGHLRGEIDQVPPMYSAKKQGGQKLYELARQGKEIERQPVRVRIHRFESVANGDELLKDNQDGTLDLRVTVSCSSGTYIRALAEDFGKQIAAPAHVAELRRTRVGDFALAQAKTLDELKVAAAEERLGRVLQSPDEAVSRFAAVDLNVESVKKIQNGVAIEVSAHEFADGDHVRLRNDHGKLIAVARFDAGASLLRPAVVLARTAE